MRFPANCLIVAAWKAATTGAKLRHRGTHFWWESPAGCFHFTAPGRRRGYLRNLLYIGSIEPMRRSKAHK